MSLPPANQGEQPLAAAGSSCSCTWLSCAVILNRRRWRARGLDTHVKCHEFKYHSQARVLLRFIQVIVCVWESQMQICLKCNDHPSSSSVLVASVSIQMFFLASEWGLKVLRTFCVGHRAPNELGKAGEGTGDMCRDLNGM